MLVINDALPPTKKLTVKKIYNKFKNNLLKKHENFRNIFINKTFNKTEKTIKKLIIKSINI